jgi:hypothetical protein
MSPGVILAAKTALEALKTPIFWMLLPEFQ